MTAPALRPLTSLQVVDTGARILGRNFVTFVGITVACVAPGIVLFFFAAATQSAGLGILGAFVAIFGFGFAFCGQVVAATLAYRSDHRPSIGDAMRQLGRRFGGFLGTLVLWGVVTFFLSLVVFFVVGLVAQADPDGFIALVLNVVATALISTLTICTVPAFVGEEVGPGKALSRAFELAGSRFGPAYLSMLVVQIIINVVVFAVAIIGAFAVLRAAFDAGSIAPSVFAIVGWVVAGALVFAAVSALLPSVGTVLYYDLRVRTEGLDVMAAVEALDDHMSSEPLPPFGSQTSADSFLGRPEPPGDDAGFVSCTNCGTSIGPGASACPFCGTARR